MDWTGNWPLLDEMMQNDDAYVRESEKICGIVLIGQEIEFNENRVCTMYRTEEDAAAQAEYFREKFERDPAFLKRSAKWYRLKVNRDLRALRKIFYIKNLGSLSNGKLSKLFVKARGHFAYNAMVDIYDWFMERVFTPVLAEYLQKRLAELGKDGQVSEYANTLIMPHQVSVIFRERTELFGIVNYIRGKKGLEALIKAKTPLTGVFAKDLELKRRVEKYFKKYIWMPCLVNNPPSTLQNVWDEIKNFVITDAPLQIKTKRLGDNHDTKAIKRSFEYIKELKPPKDIMYIIEGLRGMAFMRTEDYVVMSESTYCVIPLYTEIAKRLGITYTDLKEFMPDEIVGYLKRGEKISSSVLENRIPINCFISIDGQDAFFEGEDARKVQQTIKEQMGSVLGNATEFRGVIGNKGKARGKARVALNYKSVSETQKDEILVLASVSASFVPHLGKAAGIVAEFGGLTSHPVIVAREFNLPCVVGIKGVTSAIKDGEIIEIDADSGIIRKL